MGASRSMLEALLARVQKRANEPRPAALSAVSLAADSDVDTTPLHEIVEEDIEEYDEELIEIIDDAEVIPQAAAAARAIEPAAFGASLDRRSAAPANLRPSKPVSLKPAAPAAATPGAAASAAAAPAAAAPAAAVPQAAAHSPGPGLIVRPGARPTAPVTELRPESVSQRPITATDVARTRGTRRELKSTSFLELLDASLKLGS